MAQLSLQHIQKIYDNQVHVVKDFNLEIADKEFIVFVGPSGCGKSTTLRMIAGLETITSGDLFIGEKRMNDTPPAERGVGMVFQSYALYPHLSVAENMSFGLKLAGAKKEVINQRVNQVAEVLQLAHLLDRKPKALSGGQRQRIAIARALLRDSPILILDEATSALDTESERAIQAALDELQKNRTSLVIAHRLSTIEKADEIVVVEDGVIVERGTHNDLLEHRGVYAQLHKMQFGQ